MITCRQLINEAFVEIRFAKEVDALHGAKVSFSTDGQEWKPCVIYRGIDPESLLDCSLWEWNEGVQFGNVKFTGKPRPMFWQLYSNQLHAHHGTVHIRVEALRESGVETWTSTLELVPSRSVFVGNWQEWLPANTAWKEVDGCLTIEPGKDAPAIRVSPKLKGRYNVRVGIRTGTVIAHLRASGEPCGYPFWAERYHPEFADKWNKEVPWKTVELTRDSVIEISAAEVTVRQPKLYPFGTIQYLKFVPARRATRKKSPWADKPLALYFEPYSWAFYYKLHERRLVKETMAWYRDLGATEVHNQVIRFGSRALHHSRVAERFTGSNFMADDGTFSSTPAEMVKSLDVLRESIDACRELGITHYANAGLTNCYPGTDFEERISREHPGWRTGNVLRFSHPEVRAHVAGVIREFVEWGSDGVSIDCMRYPYHHTEEELLAIFREIHTAITSAAGGRKVPLMARIPCGDVKYFRVFEQLARESIVQRIVPSTLFMRGPLFSLKPYLKWKDYGCQVFGLIDGWLTYVAEFAHFQLQLNRNPWDIREDITRFFREGADGIFVYQADWHGADPFTRDTLDWRKW